MSDDQLPSHPTHVLLKIVISAFDEEDRPCANFKTDNTPNKHVDYNIWISLVLSRAMRRSLFRVSCATFTVLFSRTAGVARRFAVLTSLVLSLLLLDYLLKVNYRPSHTANHRTKL